jgi:methylmalonyl-CoA mutase N-terminal domain/subunit
MKEFNIPRTIVSREVTNAFQSIQQSLRSLDIPLLNSLREVQAIANGSSALYVDGNRLYRYTKIQNKLFKELVSDSVDVAEVEEIAEEVVANAPRAAEVAAAPRVTATVGIEKQDIFQYAIGNPPENAFDSEWYNTVAALQARNPQVSATDRPTNISYSPAAPVQAEDMTEVGVITYTPSVPGKLYLFVGVTNV